MTNMARKRKHLGVALALCLAAWTATSIGCSMGGGKLTSGNPTPTPTPTGSPTPSPTPTVAHSVTVSWNASTSTVQGYNVYRSAVSGGPYNRITSTLASGLQFTDQTVTAGLTYFYVVTAVDNSGIESVTSNEVSVTVP